MSHRVEPVGPLPALTLSLAAGDLSLWPSPAPTSRQPPHPASPQLCGPVGQRLWVTTVGRGRVCPGGPGLKGIQVPIVTPHPRPASLELS